MRSHLHSFFNPAAPGPGRAGALRAPRRIFWVALLVRLLYLTVAHTYRIRLAEDHFQFGWEAGRIARALVTGWGYADPFANGTLSHTGPTAWLPPLYPLTIAAVFKVFGVYTRRSAWVLLAINSVFSAATATAIYEIAARCYRRSTALWSAWLWALYPAAMQYAVRWVWEMSLTTALFAWTLVLALRLRRIGDEALPIGEAAPSSRELQPAQSWLVFGLLWGLIALSNSTLLPFAPVCGVWILLGTRSERSSVQLRGVLGAALAALVAIAVVAPWTIRNWETFHTFIPMRGNLGAELYIGNGPGSTGLLMEYDHPFQSPEQLRQYAALGEVRYSALRGELASAYMTAHPWHFRADTARRIFYFWFSVPQPGDEGPLNEYGRTVNFAFLSLAGLFGLALALRRQVPAAGLFALAFLLLPLPYYFVTVHARFRHPLEPLICILGVSLFQSADRTRILFTQEE